MHTLTCVRGQQSCCIIRLNWLVWQCTEYFLPATQQYFAVLCSISLNPPKRTIVLDEVCGRRSPVSGKTRWNLQTHTVHTVFQHTETLNRCFENIWNDKPWNNGSVQIAWQNQDWVGCCGLSSCTVMWHIDGAVKGSLWESPALNAICWFPAV